MSPQILTGNKRVWGETNHISAFNLCSAPDSVDTRQGLSLSDVTRTGNESDAYSSVCRVRRSITMWECVQVCACMWGRTLYGSFAGGPKVPPQSTSMTAVVFITNIQSQTHKSTRTVLSHIRTDPKRHLQMPDYDISTVVGRNQVDVCVKTRRSVSEGGFRHTDRTTECINVQNHSWSHPKNLQTSAIY